MKVRPLVAADQAAWFRMRHALWPAEDPAELDYGAEQFLDGKLRVPWVVFVAERHGRLVGFAEISIRPYAEGCHTDQVGFLEAWWVEPDMRRRGVGAALVHAGERWAIDQGCVEFGSDLEIGNEVSRQAHLKLGFHEATRLIAMAKRLDA